MKRLARFAVVSISKCEVGKLSAGTAAPFRKVRSAVYVLRDKGSTQHVFESEISQHKLTQEQGDLWGRVV